MSNMKIVPLIAAGDDAVRESTRRDGTALYAAYQDLAKQLKATILQVEHLERELERMRAMQEGSRPN